jgi:hypothetical protein
MSIITRHVIWAMDDSSRGRCDPAPCIAVALKEARRLQSDLYRFADEALGITRDEIDQIGSQIGPP